MALTTKAIVGAMRFKNLIFPSIVDILYGISGSILSGWSTHAGAWVGGGR